MAATTGGGGGTHGSYGGDASVISHNVFNNYSNNGFTPLDVGYNLNYSASGKFQNFVSQPTKPNPDPTNFLMQCPSNQGLLAHNDRSLMNQHSLISLANNININNNNNLFNLGYFQDNTKNSYKTSALSLYDLHYGNNLRIGGSDRLTLDFLGVNGGIVSNVNGRGGRNPAPLDAEMKFSHPNIQNHPFGKA